MKAFVATLEAVLASSLLLLLTLTLVPLLSQEPSAGDSNLLQDDLDTLQNLGELPENSSGVDSSFTDLVPEGLEYRSSVTSYESSLYRIDLSDDTRTETVQQASLVEAQLFVESASSPLSVRFNGSEIATVDSSGYRKIPLPGYGDLTFEGTGELDAVVRRYASNTTAGQISGTTLFASVIDARNGTREVRIEAWTG
nr:MAG: hypothetical protein J07AB56_09110 [Candidatus Nanosalinarum sp. J07AB56]